MGIGGNLLSCIKNLPIPSKISLSFEKHKPDILVVGGITIVVVSAVYACKKTIEANEYVKEANDRIKDIDYGEDVANGNEEFDAKVARKERMEVYRDLGVNLAKCYGPSIIGGTIGIGMIAKGYSIEKDRNVALTGAYAGLLANYKAYRDRVRNEVGTDKERDIHSGAVHKDVEITNEDGTKEVVKDAVIIQDDYHDAYTRIFDSLNKNWKPNPGSNFTFLMQQQCFANDKLRNQGHLFLNEVYDMLGFPHTSEGQIVGWIWDPDDETHGDNYVDFGIFDKAYKSAVVRDFINGYEPCIWLDFNVDGVIYEMI